MPLPIYVFDPTVADSASRVRGVGRYIEVLKENLPKSVTFTADLTTIPYSSVFVTPFFSFTQSIQAQNKKYAKVQLAVIHDLIPQKYPSHYPLGLRGSFTAFLNRVRLNNFDGIITDSKTSKRDIVDILGINQSIVHILYPAVGKRLLNAISSKSVKSSSSDSYLLYVGDATWNKNIVNIAKACIQSKRLCYFVGSVFEKEKMTQLLRSNNQWLNELKEFASLEEKNTQYIQLKGFVSDQDLATLYSNAAANLLVSRDEGFGYSYFEAAYAKCPSILADRPIFRETAGNSALFADPESPTDIAKEIKKITDIHTRKQLIQKIPAQLKPIDPDQFRVRFMEIVEGYMKKVQ